MAARGASDAGDRIFHLRRARVLLPRFAMAARSRLSRGAYRRSILRRGRTMKRLANALVFTIAFALCTSSSDAQQSAKVSRVLRHLGYEEGKNLVIESRFANSDYERLPVLAGELA